MEEKQALPTRKHPRLPYYDYRAAGGYHCTIVAKDRLCIFSRVAEGRTYLLPLGQIIRDALLELPERFTHVDLDCYEIMPNHVHVLLILRGRPAEWKTKTKPGTESGSLNAAIQAFKARVGVVGKALGYEKIFQRGFHEHVIRDEDDLYATRKYIQDNPLKWELDRENPDFKD